MIKNGQRLPLHPYVAMGINTRMQPVFGSTLLCGRIERGSRLCIGNHTCTMPSMAMVELAIIGRRG